MDASEVDPFIEQEARLAREWETEALQRATRVDEALALLGDFWHLPDRLDAIRALLMAGSVVSLDLTELHDLLRAAHERGRTSAAAHSAARAADLPPWSVLADGYQVAIARPVPRSQDKEWRTSAGDRLTDSEAQRWIDMGAGARVLRVGRGDQ